MGCSGLTVSARGLGPFKKALVYGSKVSLEVGEGHVLFELTLLRLRSWEKVDFDHFVGHLTEE